MRYDLITLGGGIDAQQAALEAARLGRYVALVAPAAAVASTEPGEPVLEVLSPAEALYRLAEQRREQGLTGAPSPEELRAGLEQILREESEIVRQHLEWSGVNVLCGTPRLINAHSVEIENPWNYWVLGTDRLLVATGTAARRPASVPFDGERILTPDDLLALGDIPGDLVIVGAGRTGLTAAVALARLGTRVIVIEGRTLAELKTVRATAALLASAEEAGVVLRLGVEAMGIDAGDEERLSVALADGGRIACGHVLWSTERVGRTNHLNLQVAGIEPDESGRLWCDELGRTWAAHVYAGGDVVGFPSADQRVSVPDVLREIFGGEEETDRIVSADVETAQLIHAAAE